MSIASAMLAASPTGARPATVKGRHAPVVARPRRLGASAGAVLPTGRATGGNSAIAATHGRKTRDGHSTALCAPLAWVTETGMEAGHGTKQAGKAASAETAHMPGA